MSKLELSKLTNNQLLAKALELEIENENLKKEQMEFLDSVADQVEEIEKSNSFWKYWKYIKLVISMIDTIKEFAAKRKQA